jgi:hypothetical protein
MVANGSLRRSEQRGGTGRVVAPAGTPPDPLLTLSKPAPGLHANPAAANMVLDDQLGELDQLDQAALRAGWVDLFGRPPPRGLSRRLLLYALSYDAQARAYGGLKPFLRRRLLQAGRGPESAEPTPAKRKLRGAPPPGSRLVREWRGRNHAVEVLENGFVYEGRQYRSLSEVARAITGARWSGPRFFGL